jgi:hypothetical protein
MIMIQMKGLSLLIVTLMSTIIYAADPNFYLTPETIIPNVITITSVTAGEIPADPLNGNASQSIVYKFIKMGGWGSVDLGTVDVNCWYIPSGFSVFTRADSNAGGGSKDGISAGLVNANSNYQNLIYNIKTNSTVTRVLTQSVVVTDFSQLAIGGFEVRINYRLSY